MITDTTAPVALTDLDPRALIRGIGGQWKSLYCCRCSHPEKIEAINFMEECRPVFDWYVAMAKYLLDSGQDEFAIRDLDVYTVREAKLPEDAPEPPPRTKSVPRNSFIPRLVAQTDLSLYDAMSRVWKTQPCTACGYGLSDPPMGAWSRIEGLMSEGVGLREAQEQVLPSSDEAEQFYLYKQEVLARATQKLKSARGWKTCLLCGKDCHLGAGEAGAVQAQIEHGIPRARWREFFGRSWSLNEDKKHRDNLWTSCSECNGAKVDNTLFEFMSKRGIVLTEAYDPRAIDEVLKFELARRRNERYRTRNSVSLPDSAEWKKIGIDIDLVA